MPEVDLCFACGRNPADGDGLCTECVAMAFTILGEPMPPVPLDDPPRPVTTLHLPGDTDA